MAGESGSVARTRRKCGRWERKCGDEETQVWRGESGSVARRRRKCGAVRAEVDGRNRIRRDEKR